MAKDHVLLLGVFFAIVCRSVFGSVPSPTNVSVICHNFVNVLYWNYSNPDDQPTFSVNVRTYVDSSPVTVLTSHTYLDISSYSGDTTDSYDVSVTTRVGQKTSESSFIKFTYSEDFYGEDTTKCSMDFPVVNASVHKDVIEVSFKHPFSVYKHGGLKDEFEYAVTVNQKTSLHSCFEDEDLCIEKINLNQTVPGQCVDLMFKGKIGGIPSHTHRNVCVPEQAPENNKTNVIMAVICGGILVFFIIVGVLWYLSKYLSKIPKIPEFLPNIMHGLSPSSFQPEDSTVSHFTSVGHKALLTDSLDSSPTSPDDEGIKTGTNLVDIESNKSAPPEENYDSSGGLSTLSDYDSPKFLMEMSPGDFTEGYGPRPAVL